MPIMGNRPRRPPAVTVLTRHTFAACLTLCLPCAEASPTQEAALLESTREVATRLNRALTGEILDAFRQRGADAAWQVCRDRAPALADAYSRQYGWRITRISLRPRNLALGSADAWEQRALKQFEQRAFLGEAAHKIELGDVTRDLQGPRYRYMKALVMEKPCLACHGKPEALSPSLKARLKATYPHDRAIGYREGQIGGAITVSRPLPVDRDDP